MNLIYDKEELPEVTKLSLSTIEEEIRQGRFPKPRLLSRRRCGWLASDIQAWADALPTADLPPPPNTGAKKPRQVTDAAAPAPRAEHQGA